MACSRPTAVAAPTLALILALASVQSGEPAHAKKKKAPRIEDASDLRIVDCLLPGKIRRLGRHSQYVTARQPIRTAAVDCEIRGGDYVIEDRGSYASSLSVWLAAAEGGDPKAQTYVGEIFEKGLAGTPDYQAAAAWYQKAAEQGFSRGQINLAQLYEKGLGVPADREQALEWYRKAAGITEDVVLDSRAQNEALRRELASANEQAAKLEEQLAESERTLDQARAELERTESEIEELRRQLEQASSQAAADVERLSSEIERRRGEVARRSAEVDAQAEDVAGRRQAFEAFRSRVQEIRSSAHGGGPTIEIVRPDVLATRGPALVPVPAGLRELAIRGKVTAPSGLESLRVDDRPLAADDDGFFRTSVASDHRREVRFVAVDRDGRDAVATLILEPQAAGAPAAGTPAAGTPAAGTPRPRGEHFEDATAGDAAPYHALIIGVSSYSHFPPLATAAGDAEELARILARGYGFSTRTLKDPSHLALLIELKSLADSLGPQDRLLIYYAGHGKIDPDRRGYWIPADAERDDDSRWIANETVSEYLDLIPARQILVVSDSCYSGTMTRSGLARRAAPERSADPSPTTGRRSRTVLTSGGLQPVLDAGGGEHSLFARALLTVLKLNDRPLTGAVLHREVAARVTFGASELGVEQVPDYAPIQFAGHETGDFVLVPRSSQSAAAPSVSP